MKSQLLLILFFLFPGVVLGQSSPAPLITDYDQTALADSLWPGPDSAFCKGGAFTIHGQYFKRALGGETWDTTYVYLGSFPGGTKARVTGIATGGGGTNDRINVELPDLFIQDTCLDLLVIKRTLAGSVPHTYSETAQVCIIGDWASVTYPDTVFCVGDQNPLPVITLSDSTSGGFCCETGAAGFYVTATGEITLHQGAVGEDNTFQFRTDHPACGDTLFLQVDIRAPVPSAATYNGITNPDFCQQAAANPVSDTAQLTPPNGWFLSPTGMLVLSDSLTGEIDLQLSQPGTHPLLYVPPDPCFDSVLLSITITAPASAQVIYPSIPFQLGSHHLCQNAPTQVPVFNSGAPGGTFFSSPPGIAFGGLGEIIPGACPADTYAICYLPPGWCADTVVVLTGLVIDSVPEVTMTLATSQFCASDTIRVDSFSGPGGGTFNLLVNDSLVAQSVSLPIPLSGLGIAGTSTFELHYILPGNCPDTTIVTGTILPQDDPIFNYPPFNSFCISDPDPWPLVGGTGGGTFSAVTQGTVVDTDGRLRLQQSGPGQHTVRYLTPGPCTDSFDVQVWIISAASASFSYPASVFCKSDTNPWPLIQGTPGGLFTADSGLVIHPDSGWIDLGLSLADTFNITYSLTGNCNVSFSQTVILLETDSSTAIDYVQEQYCPNGINPRPVLMGDSVGRFIAGAGLVFANTDSGTVDLSLTPPGGPYTVLFDVANLCAVDAVDSVWVLDYDKAYFSFSESSYCQTGQLLRPDSVALPGGTFSEPTGSIWWTDPGTGELDLDLSLPGGPYSISYTTAGDCPSTSTRSLSIYPRPAGTDLTVHPSQTVCAGTQVTFRALGAGVAVYDFRWNGDPVPSVFDLYQNDSLQNGDSITVILSTNLGCNDTLGTTVEIKPIPEVGWDHWPRVIMDGVPFEFSFPATADSTVYHWSIFTGGDIAFEPDSGTTPVVDAAFKTGFRSVASMSNPLLPDQMWISIQPEARGCFGEADIMKLDVLSGLEPVYIAEVFTPNGDGQNDEWYVSWREGEDPAGYTLLVFNRAGGEVYRMTPIHPYWTGDHLPDGVYWWTLLGPGGEKRQSGGVTIRRK